MEYIEGKTLSEFIKENTGINDCIHEIITQKELLKRLEEAIEYDSDHLFAFKIIVLIIFHSNGFYQYTTAPRMFYDSNSFFQLHVLSIYMYYQNSNI